VMVMMMGKTPDSSTRALWKSYQKRYLGASRKNGRTSKNFTYQYPRYVNWSLTCRKILLDGASGFTFHPRKCMLRIFIALKIHSLGQV
jgi:hypothetical protein